MEQAGGAAGRERAGGGGAARGGEAGVLRGDGGEHEAAVRGRADVGGRAERGGGAVDAQGRRRREGAGDRVATAAAELGVVLVRGRGAVRADAVDDGRLVPAARPVEPGVAEPVALAAARLERRERYAAHPRGLGRPPGRRREEEDSLAARLLGPRRAAAQLDRDALPGRDAGRARQGGDHPLRLPRHPRPHRRRRRRLEDRRQGGLRRVPRRRRRGRDRPALDPTPRRLLPRRILPRPDGARVHRDLPHLRRAPPQGREGQVPPPTHQLAPRPPLLHDHGLQGLRRPLHVERRLLPHLPRLRPRPHQRPRGRPPPSLRLQRHRRRLGVCQVLLPSPLHGRPPRPRQLRPSPRPPTSRRRRRARHRRALQQALRRRREPRRRRPPRRRPETPRRPRPTRPVHRRRVQSRGCDQQDAKTQVQARHPRGDRRHGPQRLASQTLTPPSHRRAPASTSTLSFTHTHTLSLSPGPAVPRAFGTDPSSASLFAPPARPSSPPSLLPTTPSRLRAHPHPAAALVATPRHFRLVLASSRRSCGTRAASPGDAVAADYY
mmetsp:Transcript_6356/g.19280  ORF Transcript_6356/g.19280 Transcript_6356/m.19280 type:complete len:550 (+) Transcript_6356:347-1996(+)